MVVLVCTYVSMHGVCMYMYVCMYAWYVHVCTRMHGMCTYECACVCVCVCTSTSAHTGKQPRGIYFMNVWDSSIIGSIQSLLNGPVDSFILLLYNLGDCGILRPQCCYHLFSLRQELVRWLPSFRVHHTLGENQGHIHGDVWCECNVTAKCIRNVTVKRVCYVKFVWHTMLFSTINKQWGITRINFNCTPYVNVAFATFNTKHNATSNHFSTVNNDVMDTIKTPTIPYPRNPEELRII